MIRIVKLLFLYLAYRLAFYTVSTGVYMLIKYGLPNISFFNESSTNIYVIIASQCLSILALGIHLIVGRYIKVSELKFVTDKSYKILLASVFLVLGMGMWVNYLSELSGLPDNMKSVFTMMMQNPFGILSIVVLAPFVEELFFRGAVQGYLLQKYNRPYIGIIISALIFGLMHANPAQIPFAFILGVVFGWVYYITGSLLPGIFMHFINNGSAVLLANIYDDADTSIISCFGENGAIVIAVSGFVISVVSILFINSTVMKLPCHKGDELSSQL